jgi:hypothetical protein
MDKVQKPSDSDLKKKPYRITSNESLTMHDLLIGTDSEGSGCGLLEGTVSELGYEELKRVRNVAKSREGVGVKGRLYPSFDIDPLYLQLGGGGHALPKWFRHYATNRKVADSVPDEVIEFFQVT